MGKIKAIWKKFKENFLGCVLKLFGWGLFICAPVVVSLAFYMVVSGESLGLLSVVAPPIDAPVSEKPRDFPLVFMAGVLVAIASMLVALGAQLLAQSKNLSEKKEERSRYCLDLCLLAYEEAWKILKDGTNKHVDWVQAGTALWNACVRKEEITEESHLRVLEVHMLKYRYAFWKILDQPNIFFYGVSARAQHKIQGLREDQLLDEANKLAKKAQDSWDPSKPEDPEVHPIPEQALYQVWLAGQFPGKKPEDNPIHGSRFSDTDQSKLVFQHQGAGDYLGHLNFKDQYGGYQKP